MSSYCMADQDLHFCNRFTEDPLAYTHVIFCFVFAAFRLSSFHLPFHPLQQRVCWLCCDCECGVDCGSPPALRWSRPWSALLCSAPSGRGSAGGQDGGQALPARQQTGGAAGRHACLRAARQAEGSRGKAAENTSYEEQSRFPCINKVTDACNSGPSST